MEQRQAANQHERPLDSHITQLHMRERLEQWRKERQKAFPDPGFKKSIQPTKAMKPIRDENQPNFNQENKSNGYSKPLDSKNSAKKETKLIRKALMAKDNNIPPVINYKDALKEKVTTHIPQKRQSPTEIPLESFKKPKVETGHLQRKSPVASNVVDSSHNVSLRESPSGLDTMERFQKEAQYDLGTYPESPKLICNEDIADTEFGFSQKSPVVITELQQSTKIASLLDISLDPNQAIAVQVVTRKDGQTSATPSPRPDFRSLSFADNADDQCTPYEQTLSQVTTEDKKSPESSSSQEPVSVDLFSLDEQGKTDCDLPDLFASGTIQKDLNGSDSNDFDFIDLSLPQPSAAESNLLLAKAHEEIEMLKVQVKDAKAMEVRIRELESMCIELSLLYEMAKMDNEDKSLPNGGSHSFDSLHKPVVLQHSQPRTTSSSTQTESNGFDIFMQVKRLQETLDSSRIENQLLEEASNHLDSLYKFARDVNDQDSHMICELQSEVCGLRSARFSQESSKSLRRMSTCSTQTEGQLGDILEEYKTNIDLMNFSNSVLYQQMLENKKIYDEKAAIAKKENLRLHKELKENNAKWEQLQSQSMMTVKQRMETVVAGLSKECQRLRQQLAAYKDAETL